MKKLVFALMLLILTSCAVKEKAWVKQADNPKSSIVEQKEDSIWTSIAITLCVIAVPVALILVISDRKRRNGMREAFLSGDYSGYDGFDDWGGHDDD